MRKTVFAAIVLACAFASGGVRGEDWPSLSKRLRDRCLGFNEALKDIAISMEMTNPSSDGAIATETKLFQKGNKFRAEIEIGGLDSLSAALLGGTETIVIGDGAKVWLVSPAAGKYELPPSEGSKYRGKWYCGDYLPTLAEIAGSEMVGGRECWILSVGDEGSDYSRVWIDAQSLVPRKLESVALQGETTTVIFSDYRHVADGYELPHRTDIFAGADLIAEIVVTSVSANTGLSDDLFDADAAAAR